MQSIRSRSSRWRRADTKFIRLSSTPITGNGEDSLKVLDPDGTTDKWMSYINLLATTGEGTVKHVNGGELLEIMGKMPKTGGGELDIGVRLFRMNENSKWSLRTALTRQHN